MNHKLFIVTLPDMTEGWEFSLSLAELAILLANQKVAVRAIEEIPDGDYKALSCPALRSLI